MDAPIKVFESCIRIFMFKPKRDLFANNINTQFDKDAALRGNVYRWIQC